MATVANQSPPAPQKKTLEELRTVKPGVLGETARLGPWPPCNWPKNSSGRVPPSLIRERKGASEDSLASQNASSLAKVGQRRKQWEGVYKVPSHWLEALELELGLKGKGGRPTPLAVANRHSLPSNRKT